MKISKLFHWLYACLMLMPIAYIGCYCIYTSCNPSYNPIVVDMFTDAVNNLNVNLLFAWAQTSFLVAPFSYISALFGVPLGSPIITLMSYWLSISIIWLVFDLIMYLPLLVHRWLDKGVIE